jgi:hypothetical protein
MRNDEVIRRFFDGKRATGGNIFSEYTYGEKLRLYSYGRHFIIAVKLKNESKGIIYLLNGDRYSSTTSQHQTLTRRLCWGQHLEIPFSVLEQITPDFEDIVIIDKTEDKYREIPYIDQITGEPQTRQ